MSQVSSLTVDTLFGDDGVVAGRRISEHLYGFWGPEVRNFATVYRRWSGDYDVIASSLAIKASHDRRSRRVIIDLDHLSNDNLRGLGCTLGL
jgi:hypothetical protein